MILLYNVVTLMNLSIRFVKQPGPQFKRSCRKVRNFALGALLLCLGLLQACSKDIQLVSTPVILTPPQILTEPISYPTPQGSSVADLVMYAKDLELALDRSNFDKSEIRRYFEELKTKLQPNGD